MIQREITRRPGRRASRLIGALDALLALTAVAAVGALVLEYGFYDPLPVHRDLLHVIEAAAVAVFVLDRLVRLVAAPSKRAYLHDNWIDFALLAVAGLVLAVSYRIYGSLLSAGALYVIITQVYILVTLVVRGVSVNLRFAGSGIHPTRLLVGSFVFLCLVGSLLLMLPTAVPRGRSIDYTDALFTATSATCVTGLIVKDTATDFTVFGQGIILVLIQLGGLGIMLFGTMLAMLMGKGLSLRGSTAIGSMLATEDVGRLGRTVAFVILITLALEAAGAILFYPMFAAVPAAGGGVVSTTRAVWHSVFHSVSSFCNAGFSLFTNNMMEGVRGGWSAPLRDYWQVPGVMAPLIVLGGLGFPVLQDCVRFGRLRLRNLARRLRFGAARTATSHKRPRLSLHTKMVLTTTAALLAVGVAGLLLIEPPPGRQKPRIGRHAIAGVAERASDDWREMPWGRRVREAAFQSVTARTAGFNTIDMAELSDGGKMLICGLMLVGGSPASTAGGMKTISFALLIATAYCVLRRRREVEVFRRSVSTVLLRRTVTLVVLYLALVGVVTLALSRTAPSQRFLDVVFEACSACGTVGLSTGMTKTLNLSAKYVLVAGMFIGRIGPLSLLLGLTSGLRRADYAYPSENLVIG